MSEVQDQKTRGYRLNVVAVEVHKVSRPILRRDYRGNDDPALDALLVAVPEAQLVEPLADGSCLHGELCALSGSEQETRDRTNEHHGQFQMNRIDANEYFQIHDSVQNVIVVW